MAKMTLAQMRAVLGLPPQAPPPPAQIVSTPPQAPPPPAQYTISANLRRLYTDANHAVTALSLAIDPQSKLDLWSVAVRKISALRRASLNSFVSALEKLPSGTQKREGRAFDRENRITTFNRAYFTFRQQIDNLEDALLDIPV